MKYMRLGTRPDTFYTEEATRSVSSDVPSDLTIQINNIRYLLHKLPLLSKCGLLRRLYNIGDSDDTSIELHEIPGGEEAFELCAKLCYGITINLSAHNFVPAICGAKFLRMTESIEKGNFILKLETFFDTCILQGWKDSIVTLQTTVKLPELSENLGIVGRCIDSIVEKILTPPAKVTWSFTYTRPGYNKKDHRSIPKDWWTEDVSDLDIDLFRFIIAALRSSRKVSPALIGEALHVYACRWLPQASKSVTPESSVAQTEEHLVKHRRVLESIVNMLPDDRGSVSCGFLLRLLKVAYLLGASPSTKAELVRRSGRKLGEATVEDLLIPSQQSSNGHLYDIDLVGAVLENFLVQFRNRASTENSETMQSMFKVAKLIDAYLKVVAHDINLPASKMVALAESFPEFARPVHDELYKAINTYLKEHPDLSKEERKRLCRILDCRKLSTDMCLHAVRNERLPLRTVVQVLFFEQERATRTGSQKQTQGYSVSAPLDGGRSNEIEELVSRAGKMGKERMPRDGIDHRKGTEFDGKQRPPASKRTVKQVMEMGNGTRSVEEERLHSSVIESRKMESKGHGKKSGEKNE